VCLDRLTLPLLNLIGTINSICIPFQLYWWFFFFSPSQERPTVRRWSRGSRTNGSWNSATDGCNRNTPDRPAASDRDSCTSTGSGVRITITATGARNSVGPGMTTSDITCVRTTETWYACPAGLVAIAAKVRFYCNSHIIVVCCCKTIRWVLEQFDK